MARPTFRVHFVTHHDGSHTGRLLSKRGNLSAPLSGHGSDEEQVYSQLALALEEAQQPLDEFLWDITLNVRRIKVMVNPQAVIKKRLVVSKGKIPVEVSYAWAPQDDGGFLVMLPRFGWWFVLEDMDMASAVIRQAIGQGLLGEKPRSMFDFRGLDEERIVPWSPSYKPSAGTRRRQRDDEHGTALHAVAEDLSARERKSRRRPIVGDIVTPQQLAWVTRERPRSILLVGPAGCGKTTWVRALARTLAQRSSSKQQMPKIWSTSADRIFAGMKYLGEWEQRCLDLIEELSGEGDLLFVDKLAPLCSARTGTSIADLFAPAIASGELTIIAECSGEEHERLASQHPTFVGRFVILRIEPTASGAMPHLLEQYQARIDATRTFTGEALRVMVQLLEFFQRDRGFPGKGMRFLDWLTQSRGPDATARANIESDDATVADAFARYTGLPLELISDRKVASREVVGGRLRRGVIGQDRACEVAAGVLTRFKAGLCDPQRPIGSLFFVGPTGVGKTELAKQLARYMFSDAERMIRLDMSEYMLPGSGQRLLAVGQGVESLVQRVRRNPLSLVLLDEVEKAHPEVFDLLLAMLGEGRMTDADGVLVDFRMTLVVMTSNLGVRASAAPGFGGSQQTDDDLLSAVRAHFRPEFFNRIDNVVPFRSLAVEDLLRVVGLELEKAGRRAGLRDRGLTLRADEDARARLAELGWHPARGARPLKRVIEERIISVIAVQLAEHPMRDTSIPIVARDSPAHARLASSSAFVVVL